jgi:hypothetical protein
MHNVSRQFLRNILQSPLNRNPRPSACSLLIGIPGLRCWRCCVVLYYSLTTDWNSLAHSASSHTQTHTHASSHPLSYYSLNNLTHSLTHSSGAARAAKRGAWWAKCCWRAPWRSKRTPPTHSLTHSFTHPLTPSPTHSLLHSLSHSVPHSLTHPPTHTLSLSRPFTHHSLTLSLTHSLTHSLKVYCTPGVPGATHYFPAGPNATSSSSQINSSTSLLPHSLTRRENFISMNTHLSHMSPVWTRESSCFAYTREGSHDKSS